ncbi:MAG: T9SS type A sorting domain-containing protein, partial [Flavobacteriales bacterium]
GSLEFTIEIIADSLEEGDEFIDLTLTAPGSVSVGLSSTTITIAGELFVENVISISPVIHLYPNPSNEYINLVSDVMINSIQIFNQVGQQVITEKFIPVMMKVIDATALTNGMYQMVIHTERGKQSMRFVVSH